MIDWKYECLGVNSVSGRNTTQDNFTSETNAVSQILVRELIQNSLDAKLPEGVDPVVIKITEVKWSHLDEDDTEYMQKLFPENYKERLRITNNEGIPKETNKDDTAFLLLEDFGTTGLLGIYNNPRYDNPRNNDQEEPQNWNAFWFREGEGDKRNDFGNGRAGQGKVTYYSVSESRNIFALTIREEDKKSLVFGRSLFSRDYKYEKNHFSKIAYWSIRDSETAIPSEDQVVINQFKKYFHLKRTNEPGLSIVIPYPLKWEMSEITGTIVEDFFIPIMSGKLIVHLGDQEFNRKNILNQNREYLESKQLSHKIASYTFLSEISTLISTSPPPLPFFIIKEEWCRSKHDIQPFGENLSSFLDLIEKHKIIHLKCEISLLKKNGSTPTPSWFDIYIQKNGIPGKAVQFYSRLDMMIGEEKNEFIKKLESFTILTHIKDKTLSQFLNDAETPTHLKWNPQNSRLKENWEHYKKELSFVRNAAEYIMKIVLQQSKAKDDLSSLAIYFPASSEGKDKGSGKNSVPKLTNNLAPAKMYSNNKQDFIIEADTGYDATEKRKREFTVKFAYNAGGTKDDKILKENSLKSEHIDISYRGDNEIVFTPLNKDFKLKISNLSKHIPVSASLRWKFKTEGNQ